MRTMTVQVSSERGGTLNVTRTIQDIGPKHDPENGVTFECDKFRLRVWFNTYTLWVPVSGSLTKVEEMVIASDSVLKDEAKMRTLNRIMRYRYSLPDVEELCEAFIKAEREWEPDPMDELADYE